MQKATFAVYEFGPYRLDAGRRLLLREGHSLTLGPKTFDLLLLLLQNRDRVLTKKELMGALWPDSFVEEANLAFQISALRKVLGTQGAEWIETLPRYGYRFNGDVSEILAKIGEPLETPDPSTGELHSVYESVAPPRISARKRMVSLGSAAVVLFAAGSMVGRLAWRESPPAQRVVRFLVLPPSKITIPELDSIALSPDGSRLGFIGAAADGQQRLWVRDLDSVTAEPLAGTELVTSAFWSPDSDSIGFFAAGKLKRIDLHGGSPQTLCTTSAGRGTWSPSGVILFDAAGPEIYQIPAAGGEPKPATALNKGNQETFHASPQFLPDGRRFIYLVQSARPENAGIYIATLGTKESRRIVGSNTNAAYASGYLFFTAGTDLVRQAFDLKKLTLFGEPSVLARRVLIGMTRGLPRAAFSASQNGVLAYRTRTETGASELVWFDRQGRRLSSVGEPGDYSNPALSANEKTLVVSRADAASRARHLWLIDLSAGASSRFTFDPVDETNAVWSPDGKQVAFDESHNGGGDIYLKSVTGADVAKELLTSKENKQIECWSPDGRFLLYRVDQKIWAFPLSGGNTIGPFAMEYPRISPNGKWVAYTSGESGRTEVYVQSFPPMQGKWQVSTDGGTEPLWRRDGDELYYISGNRLMAVDVKTNLPAFEAGIPKLLFEAPLESTRRRSRYQVVENGRRFLLNLPVETSSAVTVTVNWAGTSKP